MPVRSLNSSVFKWPDKTAVDQAVRAWAEKIVAMRKDVLRVGYFGSYARGDWGVGSDLDLIIIVQESDLPVERRLTEWDTTELPVPTDVLVYTEQEWQQLSYDSKFRTTVEKEAVWLWVKEHVADNADGSPH